MYLKPLLSYTQQEHHPLRRTFSDPLSVALLPPPDESPIDRDKRFKKESQAKKISDSVDDMIRQERNQREKIRPEVNVLLLGQSEAGKSTTLKREPTCMMILCYLVIS